MTNQYRLRYTEPSTSSEQAVSGYDATSKANKDYEMSTLKFELARMEAKIDILTALVMRADTKEIITNTNKPSSASEHALCRSMTIKQHVTVQLLILGRANKEIAEIINIGENTVKLHVRAVCKKIGCKTRGQAALVMSEILTRMDPSEYERSSGGLPIDWASNLSDPATDRYAALYRTEGK